MSSSSNQIIFSQIVPLVCQGLTLEPEDESVWLEGLSTLSNPKLKRAMSSTTSIWLPLLLKGLDIKDHSEQVNIAALKLLGAVAEIVEPMKNVFLKPLRNLIPLESMSESEEYKIALTKLGLSILDNGQIEIGRAPTAPIPSSADHTSKPTSKRNPRDHPVLAQIIADCLPAKPRTVQQAWTHTLFVPNPESNASWLRNLYQATVESCGVPELMITSKLDIKVHEALFQTAFVKCYDQLGLDPEFKAQVDSTLIRLLTDPKTPKDIVEVILELLAFLDKEQKKMVPEILKAATERAMSDLGDLNKHLGHENLWLIEREAERTLLAERIGDLVEANIRIGSSGYDSAWSSLLWLRDDHQQQPDPMWITQLSHWQKALDAQEADDGGVVTTFGSFNTRMVCYHALGQFDKGYELAQAFYEGLNDYERKKTSHWATAAAWHMGDYDAMSDYLAFHPKGTSKSLYKAIIDVHSGQYAPAFHHISKAQALSYDELQTHSSLNSSTAIKTLAKTEYLVELGEVITYKSQPDQRAQILDNWRKRFKRSHADSNNWLRRLQIWSLACEPTTYELQVSYIDCAKLCESQGMHEAAQRIIELVTPQVTPPGCKVEYMKLRFLWKDAEEKRDIPEMKRLIAGLQTHADGYLKHLKIDKQAFDSEGLGMQPLSSTRHVSQRDARSLGRRMYRIGQWIEVLQGPDWVSDPASEVLKYYSQGSKLDRTWFAGSYALATAAMSIFESSGHERRDPIAINNYVVPAVRGLFQAARSEGSPEKIIKALLRLVTVWFRYGEVDGVLIEVEQQLLITSVSSWLQAIPQLIARLGTQHKELQGVLVHLLKDIASAYPHAVIWPLLTASQSKAEHQEAADIIMDHITQMKDGGTLVRQAETVGKELIRVSCSWMEKWRSMIDKCLPRTEIMEIAWHEIPDLWKDDMEALMRPETPDEDAFVQRFGRSIESVYTILKRYKSTRSVGYAHTAYTEVYKLFGDLDAAISHQYKVPNAKLHLQNTAPRLLALRDCILTVPGQYDASIQLDDQAFIDSFPSTVEILSSKMLPRKLSIRSWRAQRDEFTDFTFLLKGNEDLRGDERVMQLFTLVNTLLNHNSESFSRNLHLLPYKVIPLSPSAGLLSWVSNTQQLQGLITAQREKTRKHKLSDKEMASMLGYDPENFDFRNDKPRLDLTAEMDKYEVLPSDIKVERLKSAWSHSKQTDLKDVLWQRSPSSEVWIRRRTNFARTLGVGSMVGHIIGLGDRHGSNILVDQLTWGALHIDFGDLFMIAQERSYLPEKVPFRLTRMMTNAFELASYQGHPVPGSRGSYKQASIVSMEVLRENRGTLLAMLEAFLYDPLLHWTTDNRPSTTTVERSRADATTSRAFDKSQKTLAMPLPTKLIAQSVAPALPRVEGDSDVYKRIDNSLVANVDYTNDSWVAKVAGGSMTNAKALKVLAAIEKKLAGFEKGSEKPMVVKTQVQHLIAEATEPRNLSQGMSLY